MGDRIKVYNEVRMPQVLIWTLKALICSPSRKRQNSPFNIHSCQRLFFMIWSLWIQMSSSLSGIKSFLTSWLNWMVVYWILLKSNKFVISSIAFDLFIIVEIIFSIDVSIIIYTIISQTDKNFVPFLTFWTQSMS